MILGSHVSFSKGALVTSVESALSYGANTFMFYTGAPQNTVRKELDLDLALEAKKLMEENNIDINNVICHAPYIINLASSKEEQWNFSIEFLMQEIKRCKMLGVSKVVIHPGNAVGIEKSEGLDNVVRALKKIVNDDVEILIETMAGKGTELCSSLEEIKFILDIVNHDKLGVCLDTCHLNDSGVDIKEFDTYIKQFDKMIGIEKIRCIHVNDSKNELGMKKDRHENFGLGTIGFDALINVIYHEKLKDVPKILETPYVAKPDSKDTYPPYKFEIEMIKNKKMNENLLEDIINFYK